MDVECGKCGKMVSSDKVKVDTVNQWYVCSDCLKEDAKEKQRKYEHQKMKERESQSSKMEISCRNCGYTYLFDTWKKFPSTCPYCDRKSPGVK